MLRQSVTILKEIQREAVKIRELWIEGMTIKNAIAGGDPDAQKILKTILHKMHTQSLNAKLNRITQEEIMGIDYIEVTKGEWFL